MIIDILLPVSARYRMKLLLSMTRELKQKIGYLLMWIKRGIVSDLEQEKRLETRDNVEPPLVYYYYFRLTIEPIWF